LKVCAEVQCGSPIMMSGWGADIRRGPPGPPALWEHTEEVFHEIAHIKQREVACL
jgi:hypothetical protein